MNICAESNVWQIWSQLMFVIFYKERSHSMLSQRNRAGRIIYICQGHTDCNCKVNLGPKCLVRHLRVHYTVSLGWHKERKSISKILWPICSRSRCWQACSFWGWGRGGTELGLSPTVWWLMTIFGAHWWIGLLPQSLPSCSCNIFPVGVSVPKFLPLWGHQSYWIRGLPCFSVTSS